MKKHNIAKQVKLLYACVVLSVLTSLFLLGFIVYDRSGVGIPLVQTFFDERDGLLYKNSTSIEQFIIPVSLVEELSELYSSSKIEFVRCVQADQSGKDVLITGFRSVPTFSANESGALFYADTCGVAFVHSHPSGSCSMSPNDFFTWGSAHQKFTMLQCGVSEFRFFSAEGDVWIPVPYTII